MFHNRVLSLDFFVLDLSYFSENVENRDKVLAKFFMILDLE